MLSFVWCQFAVGYAGGQHVCRAFRCVGEEADNAEHLAHPIGKIRIRKNDEQCSLLTMYPLFLTLSTDMSAQVKPQVKVIVEFKALTSSPPRVMLPDDSPAPAPPKRPIGTCLLAVKPQM